MTEARRDVAIRPFQASDAPELAQIYFSAIHEIASQHYSGEQVRAWAAKVPDPAEFAARGSDGRILLVAVDAAGRPLAYGDVEKDGHIDHLFCRPEVAGSGVTAALYQAMEAAAKRRQIRMLYVEASEPARRFFLKHGFEVVERRDFELSGVAIHNYRMEKTLR